MKEIPKVIAVADMFSTPAVFLLYDRNGRDRGLWGVLKDMFFVWSEEDFLKALEQYYVVFEATGLKAVTKCELLSPENYELEIVVEDPIEGYSVRHVHLQRLPPWPEAKT